VKSLTVSALSAGTGAGIAGPMGALVGAAAAKTFTGVGFDLFGEFVLSGVIAGWKPRNCFEKILYPRAR
jgi:hypothetical protein